MGQIACVQLAWHYGDVIMGAIASQITSPTIVYSAVYSDADQMKHQRSASLAFVRGIHRRPVNSPHKLPVTWKIFPFDDVIMIYKSLASHSLRILCHLWHDRQILSSLPSPSSDTSSDREFVWSILRVQTHCGRKAVLLYHTRTDDTNHWHIWSITEDVNQQPAHIRNLMTACNSREKRNTLTIVYG